MPLYVLPVLKLDQMSGVGAKLVLAQVMKISVPPVPVSKLAGHSVGDLDATWPSVMNAKLRPTVALLGSYPRPAGIRPSGLIHLGPESLL